MWIDISFSIFYTLGEYEIMTDDKHEGRVLKFKRESMRDLVIFLATMISIIIYFKLSSIFISLSLCIFFFFYFILCDEWLWESKKLDKNGGL